MRLCRSLALAAFYFLAIGASLYSPFDNFAQAGRQTKDASQADDFDSISRAASSYRDSGETKQAIESYGRALQLRPDWAEGWWYLGTLKYGASEFPDATRAFQNLVRLAPRSASAWEFLGLCKFETKDYSDSLLDLEKGARLGGGGDPEISRVANYHLALLLIRKGDFEKASVRILAFFGSSHMPPQAKAALGLALLRIPLLPQEIDPSKEALIDEMGDIAELLAQSKLAEASKEFQLLIELYPKTPYLHYAYGLVLTHFSRLQDAIAQMRDEIVLSPKSALPWMELAKLYGEEKNLREAVLASRRATVLAPESEVAHRALAEALEKSGEKVEASKELKAVQKLSSEKPERELRIVHLYANAAVGPATERVHAVGDKASSPSAPASGDFEALSKQAIEAERSGEVQEAIALYTRALVLRPDWQEGNWNRAMLYYTTSQFPQAIAALKEWVGKHPGSGTGWGVLGLCEFAVRDYDNALIHLQRGNDLGFGADANAVRTARYHLGILLIRNKEFDRAREMLSAEPARPALAAEIQFALGLAILRMPLLPEQVSLAQVPLVTEAGDVAQLLESSKYDEAFPKLQGLLTKYPDTPFLHYIYGTALASFSRYNQAETQFKDEMSVSPQSELPVLGLASVLLQARRPQDALPYTRRAAQLAPDSANAHYLLGRALLETDQAQASIVELLLARQLSPESPEVHFTLARAYAKAKQPEKASQERAIFVQLKAEADQARRSQPAALFGGFQKEASPASSELRRTQRPSPQGP